MNKSLIYGIREQSISQDIGSARGSIASDVYINGRHRNADMGGNKKWGLYCNGKQGQDLITSDFECGMEVLESQSHVEVTVVGAVTWD